MLIILTISALNTNNKSSQKEASTSRPLNFHAEVIEIRETSILVQKLNGATEMRVYTSETSDTLVIGDLVSIQYNGKVKETIPPVITALSIKKVTE